jgi:hypothetical protein
MRALAVAAAVAVAVVAVVLTANFLLLGVAVERNDPVGKLVPVADLGGPPRPLRSVEKPGSAGTQDDHGESAPDD